MEKEKIVIENKWTESDLLKIIPKYYVTKPILVVIVILELMLIISILREFINTNALSGANIINLILIFVAPTAIYLSIRKSAKRMISRCKNLAVTNMGICVDENRLDNINKIIISKNLILIENLKSFFLIKLPIDKRNDIIDLVKMNNVELIDLSKNFSIYKLYYRNKI